jgi:hypothetical protein
LTGCAVAKRLGAGRNDGDGKAQRVLANMQKEKAALTGGFFN